MTSDEPPVGELFSKIYIERGKPQRDSIRFRRRLAYYVHEHLEQSGKLIASMLRQELGAIVSNTFFGPTSIHTFFVDAELPDILNAITLLWRVLTKSGYNTRAEGWLRFVQRVIAEENLGYRVDEKAGVHYFVDEEFERNRTATIQCLANPKYAAVASEFESAYQKLDEDPADTKGAIRAVFEGLETFAKLMVDKTKIARLNEAAVEKHLKPIAQRAYSGDPVALNAANQLLSGLSDWVNAAHQYRHGQKTQEPTVAPLGLAVAMVSSGATYIRWLVELDQQANQ